MMAEVDAEMRKTTPHKCWSTFSSSKCTRKSSSTLHNHILSIILSLYHVHKLILTPAKYRTAIDDGWEFTTAVLEATTEAPRVAKRDAVRAAEENMMLGLVRYRSAALSRKVVNLAGARNSKNHLTQRPPLITMNVISVMKRRRLPSSD